MFRHRWKTSPTEFLQVDTTNILFICGGAFAGLDKVIEKNEESKGTSIGFGAKSKSNEETTISEIIKN